MYQEFCRILVALIDVFYKAFTTILYNSPDSCWKNNLLKKFACFTPKITFTFTAKLFDDLKSANFHKHIRLNDFYTS